MQRKTMYYQGFCQLSHLNKGFSTIDFSTEHNLTSIYRYFFIVFLASGCQLLYVQFTLTINDHSKRFVRGERRK